MTGRSASAAGGRGGESGGDDPQRLFVAVVPPDPVRTLIAAARAPARDRAPELTWTRPQGWHVTCAFLGDVAAADVARVTTVVHEVAARTAPIEAELAGAGGPDDRVLWLEVRDDPAGALAELGERLRTALAAAGLPVARGVVRPHLTLARAARGRRVDAEVVGAVAAVRASFEVAHLVVMRSLLGDGPARYEPVAVASLAEVSAGAPDASSSPDDGVPS